MSSIPKLNLELIDDCDPNPISKCIREKVMSNCFHEYLLIDTCEISDRCNNVAHTSRAINVIDDTPPQLSGIEAEDRTYECTELVSSPLQVTTEIGATFELLCFYSIAILLPVLGDGKIMDCHGLC
eukprot:TRINITY_DN7159_c0_g1_i1.p1 TRINITY_DN7159_c0_g1~~TRINITY_DN7159_c0_g1_i1.p1  ORF type:complete len:126 (-),score=14.80 TRINITY_DN7159_c0_g1_i1:41-418(-)